MDRSYESGTIIAAPTPPAAPSTDYPTNGDASTGVPATEPGEYWFHMITEELRKVITSAGLTPDSADLAQLYNAILLLNRNPYIKLSEVQASGIDGGTLTSGVWQTRILNTKDSDTHGNASLASNQFTLQPGTYHIYAAAPAYTVDSNKLKLRNISDAIDELIGSSVRSGTGSDAVVKSVVAGEFTITAAKTFELQHQCQTTGTNVGLGKNTGFGVSEIYAVVELWKVK